MRRLVVLISGNGSNLQALIDAIAAGTIEAEVALVVSNRERAYGLERARRAGIATLCFLFEAGASVSRHDYESMLADRVEAARPDLIVLAGWMHILGSAFLERFPGKVINLHPALLGAFPGTRAIERALEAYRDGRISETGVMVHRVIPQIDAGPVLGARTVPILPNDNLETLSERMHAAEHEVLVAAVRKLLREM
jgi:formyltetrahydrofolate-dependent phosphoribosylglycinamide formyltransferase